MISTLLDRQRRYVLDGGTRQVAVRKSMLRALQDGIARHESGLLQALHTDLRKSQAEAYLSEIGWLHGEIRHAIRQVDKGCRPKPDRTPLSAWPGKVRVCREPMGNTLILGPWNYPLQLTLGPLVAAISAGNTAVIKPSEQAPHTSAAIKQLINASLPTEWASVVEGGTATSTELLHHRWDLVFFTGGTEVGRKVMQAAAKHLTPVILELGGKCPCIVMKDADLEISARRILWGKTLNAGQTCVAPDHVWVQKEIMEPLCHAMKRAIKAFFGENPQSSPDYGRLIHHGQWQRLTQLLEGAEIIHGGGSDPADLYIEPTLVRSKGWDCPLMQEEIFGPILPVLEFSDLPALLAELASRPSPLAVYAFTHSRDIQQRIEQHTRSGAVCVNDTIVHLLGRDLPFGGIGDSGTGRYHGKAGFNAFSHERVVMTRRLRFDAPFRYPPATIELKWLRRLARWL